MTVVFGWQDQDEIFLCADSAVTRENAAPQTAQRSFGEAQVVDGVTVEESAVKILVLPRETLAAVSGYLEPIVRFLSRVSAELEGTDKSLRDIITSLASLVDSDPNRGFAIQFAYLRNKDPTLMCFSSARGFEDPIGDAIGVLGSLPVEKQRVAVDLINAIRRRSLPPDARLAACLVTLQATGITDYLGVHGVGGAFFGVRLNRSGIEWQPDLNYFTYSPRSFPRSHAKSSSSQTPLPMKDDVERVRVLVRDGAGIILSSVGSPHLRLFIPPNTARTDSEWEEFVKAAVPPPHRLVVRSQHYGFLSRAYRKAVYIYAPVERDDGAIVITPPSDSAPIQLTLVDRLVETLKNSTPIDAFDLTLVVQDDDGTQADTLRLVPRRQ